MAGDSFFSQMAGFFSSSSPQKKGSMFLGLIAIFAIVGSLFYFGARPNMAILMSNLDPKDAGEITSYLKSQKIHFSIDDGGATIYAPEKQVHALRLDLASRGLPKGGGVGFEVFDEAKFGMSQFAERLNYVRALQGELQRTIKRMQHVVDVRVHISVPKKSVFEEQQEKARASVALELERGRELEPMAIQAITHLVTSSVEGLESSEVTIVDSRGAMLKRGGDSMGELQGHLEHQIKYETAVQRQVMAIVEPIVGHGNAKVRANAHFDFTRVEKTTEKFDPDAAVIRSEQTSEEVERNGDNANGIPGTESNLKATKSDLDKENASGLRRQYTKNYDISKTVSHETTPTATLTRLSVAVLVNGVLKNDADGNPYYEPRTAAELRRITDLVRTAIGFNELRGDQVEVQSIPFGEHVEEAAKAAAAAAEKKIQEEGISEKQKQYMLIAGAVLLLIFVVLMTLRSRVAVDYSPQLVPAAKTVRELENALERHAATVASAGVVAPPPPPPPEDEKPVDPIRAAAVIKWWLSESR